MSIPDSRTQLRIANKARRDRFASKHPKYGMVKYRERRFGLTATQYNIMVEQQGNRCAICNEEEPGYRNGVRKALAVDHNRVTGANRRLLCSRCNTAIGLLRERIDLLEKTIEYLRYHE